MFKALYVNTFIHKILKNKQTNKLSTFLEKKKAC